jgi:hypothetical protein
VDEATIVAGLRRLWEYETRDIDLSHEIYHDDAVLEFPQSRERFEGKANFLAWRRTPYGTMEDRGTTAAAFSSSGVTRSPEKRSASRRAGSLPTGARRGGPSGRTSPWVRRRSEDQAHQRPGG